MVYMGSKNKLANKIVPILQNIIDENGIKLYIEPFVGGANIIDKIKCHTKIGIDKNYPLIALHEQAQKDFSIIPEHGSPEWWYKAKDIYRKTKGNRKEILTINEMEGWEIGAIAFFGSFSNGGFSRGYAKNKDGRDYYNEAYRNFKTQVESPLYKDIIFLNHDYREGVAVEPALIYCDPPYQNTKPYGYKFETEFDYDEYWNWVREMSEDNIVICSEQNFPDDFEIIWEQEVKRGCSKNNQFKATEKLGWLKK